MRSEHSAKPSSTEIVRLLGQRAVLWEPITRHGATNNRRWRVRMADGTDIFVKRAVDDQTVRWLRAEYHIYRHIQTPCVPRLLGWIEGEFPSLILEDLGDAKWPPPWTIEDVSAVRHSLNNVANTSPPAGLPRLEDSREMLSGWHRVAQDPSTFLTLGLCSRDWLDTAISALLDASEEAVLDGDSLLHVDIRSDNLCIRGGRAILFDWNHAAIGNAMFDLVSWLPSLHAEGGPRPEMILPQREPLGVLLAGYWASRAGLPPIPGAPRARELQLMQLRVALPWAGRMLGLPDPIEDMTGKQR